LVELLSDRFEVIVAFCAVVLAGTAAALVALH
jgi:hypothetical protein